MPSHSSSSRAPWVPHTQAVAHEVVGRRTPTAESSSPVSALNVEDLPEPVAPAMPTTVWSAESLSRPPARSTTARASATSSSLSRPSEASTAVASPSRRSPMSEPLVTRPFTAFLALSNKDMLSLEFSATGLRLVARPD